MPIFKGTSQLLAQEILRRDAKFIASSIPTLEERRLRVMSHRNARLTSPLAYQYVSAMVLMYASASMLAEEFATKVKEFRHYRKQPHHHIY